MVKMTDGHGESVRGIVWLRYFGKRKQRLDHLLNLKLLGVAMAHTVCFTSRGEYS